MGGFKAAIPLHAIIYLAFGIALICLVHIPMCLHFIQRRVGKWHFFVLMLLAFIVPMPAKNIFVPPI